MVERAVWGRQAVGSSPTIPTMNLTESRSSILRIQDHLTACDGLIDELEEALSRAEAALPEEAPEELLVSSRRV